ncbi:hypothetical protein BHM03_00056285 [Ensete ventricosum]|nr:hypothetical protein BHM03_00056285 [Ensete ventricosum]
MIDLAQSDHPRAAAAIARHLRRICHAICVDSVAHCVTNIVVLVLVLVLISAPVAHGSQGRSNSAQATFPCRCCPSRPPKAKLSVTRQLQLSFLCDKTLHSSLSSAAS